jgi:hypothetical protein
MPDRSDRVSYSDLIIRHVLPCTSLLDYEVSHTLKVYDTCFLKDAKAFSGPGCQGERLI